MTEPAIKRRRTNSGHRWVEAQVQEMLYGICEQIKENVESLEKPTAQKFYEKISAKAPSLAGIPWQVMKTKLRYMKQLYMTARDWKQQTGAGLLAGGDEKSVAEYVNKTCPHFDELEEIFGRRKGVNPSCIFSSTTDCDPQSTIIELNSACNDDFNFEVSNESYEGEYFSSSTQFSGNAQVNPIDFEQTSSQPYGSSSSSNSKEKRAKNKNVDTPLSILMSIQKKKLELEERKFEWQIEKDTMEMEINKLERQQKLELKAKEIEKDERIAQMKLESDAKLKKYEIELKYKIQQEKGNDFF